MRRYLLVLLVLASSVGAIAALRWSPAEAGTVTTAPREIVLVARGMAFYLADDSTVPNPTIRLRPGERVRLVLRNEEAGISHSFAVPAWGVETRLLQGAGSDTIELSAPATPGRQEYRCTPHAAMMRGTIEIR